MSDESAEAIERIMSFDCKKHTLKQSASGVWELSLKIRPAVIPNGVMLAAPGTRYMASLSTEIDGQTRSTSFECKKHGSRQEQSGTWTFALKISPPTIPGPILMSPPGLDCICCLVAKGDDERALPPGQIKMENKRQMLVCNQAGMMIKNEEFQKWLVAELEPGWGEGEINADLADRILKRHLKIESKTELDESPEARALWDALFDQFATEHGWRAEEQ